MDSMENRKSQDQMIIRMIKHFIQSTNITDPHFKNNKKKSRKKINK